MDQENEDNKDESFYKALNRLYKNYQEEKTSDDKRDREQEIILKIWNNVPSWQEYPDVVVANVHKHLSKKSKYDSSKGEFSRYILTVIRNEIKKQQKEEEKYEERKINLKTYKNNRDDKEYKADEDILTEMASSSPNSERKLTDIEVILTADLLRVHLRTIQEALLLEEENPDKKATLMTREILYKLKIEAHQLITEKVYYLAAEFDFIDKQVWGEYFHNLDILPSQKELANKIGISDNTASQMLKRFKKRLKENFEKRNKITKFAEG